MAQAIAFITPGHIDLRAFTTFGVNSKPNSDNPIGFFGTGLKYAIAVLVREGLKVQVYIGKDKYTFAKKPMKFRDKDFDGIRMIVEKWGLKRRYADLPFTTEHGKNWVLWQAYRELESNTRDEGGQTMCLSTNLIEGVSNQTTIYVEGSKFVETWEKRDDVFLNRQESPLASTDELQVFRENSPYLYYRNLRVMDLDKPSVFTYNIIITQTLTEDRTIKFDWFVKEAVAKAVTQSDDEWLIESVITAPKGHWEHGLDFTYVGRRPSETFVKVYQRHRTNKALNHSIGGYYAPYMPRPVYNKPKDIWELHPRPWKQVSDTLTDANGQHILAVSGYEGHKGAILEALLKLINGKPMPRSSALAEIVAVQTAAEDEIPF